MSSFTDTRFFGYCDIWHYAVSKEKYSKEEAIEKAKVEMQRPFYKKPHMLMMSEEYLRWNPEAKSGMDPCVGWHPEHEKTSSNSVPVWFFSVIPEKEDITPKDGYAYIRM